VSVGAAERLSAGGREPARSPRLLPRLFTHLVIILVTLAGAEAMLRVLDFRELRNGYRPGESVAFRYDAELGWSPIPHSAGDYHGARPFSVKHNSLGLRDIEPEPTPKPTILFLGDSFVWGYDADVGERFSDLLRADLPGFRVLSAGVPGYGTDQEYLLLKRIWSAIKPDVVVLIFCTANDRENNSSNSDATGRFKPYLERAADGAWRFAGQPVPRSRHAYFHDNALVRNLWLARLAVSGFVQLRHARVTVPDPTEHLIDMTRDFVESNGARFMVGLQYDEPPFEAFLQARKIPYVSVHQAQQYQPDGAHWTPEGHRLVARRLGRLLSAAGFGATAQAGR
jgi:lysophospholipase L1-like esterase